jgi:CubicO group peptidase (beta-lactamase class C family)
MTVRCLKITLELDGREVKAAFGMRRRDFLGFGLLSLAACSYRKTDTALSEDRLKAELRTSKDSLVADLEKQIPEWMEKANVPGLSMAIVQDGKVVWRRGFGFRDSRSKEPVDNDTVFEAGSMSKPVFAYVVMKLCEKGVLDLDTPLTKYTSEEWLAGTLAPPGDARLDLITARHVLSHTSGFQNWRSKNKPLKIHFQPGEQFRYSGEGYFYLQSVVTHLTGHVDRTNCRRYEDGLEVCATDIDPYMNANLLGPFGMSSSGYLWNDTLERHAARPHDRNGAPLDKKKPTAPNVARYGAAGGLHTTPTEYAKFLIEVIDQKRSDAFRLRKDSLEEMVRPHVKTNDKQQSSWALGWQVQHTTKGDFICHGGYNTGFHSFAAASVKRKSGYVLMTNGDSAEEIIKYLMLGETMSRILAA